jgi:hypothetical protein
LTKHCVGPNVTPLGAAPDVRKSSSFDCVRVATTATLTALLLTVLDTPGATSNDAVATLRITAPAADCARAAMLGRMTAANTATKNDQPLKRRKAR